jgi:hypothetical protein
MGTKDYCSNRGSCHIERYNVKLGKQKCEYCRAEIDVVEDPKMPGWALIPMHEPKRKPRA